MILYKEFIIPYYDNESKIKSYCPTWYNTIYTKVDVQIIYLLHKGKKKILAIIPAAIVQKYCNSNR